MFYISFLTLAFTSFLRMIRYGRSFRAESLPELWNALPRMKTIAQPFDRAEQVLFLLFFASI
jgi:hypothetical protein